MSVKGQQHTLGPWTIHDCRGPMGGAVWIKEQNAPVGADFTWAPRVIASVNVDVKQAEANARLIAAAPDLLTVAHNALHVFKAMATSKRRANLPMIEQLETAITKAKGK